MGPCAGEPTVPRGAGAAGWPCPASLLPPAGPHGDAPMGTGRVPPPGSTCPPEAEFDIGVIHLCHGMAHGTATATRRFPPAAALALPWPVLPATLAQEGWPSGFEGPPGIPGDGCQHPGAANLAGASTASLLPRVGAGAVPGREMLSTGGAQWGRGCPARSVPALPWGLFMRWPGPGWQRSRVPWRGGR